MGSSLSNIPGAGDKGRGRRSRAGRDASKPWRPPPRQSVSERTPSRRSMPRFTPRMQIDPVNLALAAAFALIVLIGIAWLVRANRIELGLDGLAESGAVTESEAAALTLDFTVEPASRLDSASLTLDGEDIMDEVERTDRSLRWSPNPADPLAEEPHEFTLSVPRAVAGTAEQTFIVRVDDTEPELEVDPIDPVALGDELTVTGKVSDAVPAEVEIAAGDNTVSVDDEGRFELAFDSAPSGAVELIATDPAGNATTTTVVVPVDYPGTHAIHLGIDSWANESIRAAVLDQMGSAFDAVVLDVKDECGFIGGDIGSDLADRIGANRRAFDLAEAAAAIQDAGGRAVARVVVYRDPALTAWAWSNAKPDWVLQDTSGSPWPDFNAPDSCDDPGRAPPLGGGAASFVDPEVRAYMLDVVRATAAAGFDDVMLDDVRRPSGDPANLAVTVPRLPEPEPGQDRVTSLDPIAEVFHGFLAEARRIARGEGAYLGVTASGLSVRDPAVYSQDLGRFATAVDYIAPEIYPESYSSGFFNLDSPIDTPGPAVAGALEAVREQTGDVPIELVPWIQDYSGAVPYDAADVQAQIDSAGEVGSCSYVREDPDRNYTAGVEPAC